MIALPELPSQLVVHILKLLPPIAQAYSGKLVNKAAYKALKASRLIAASTDVPVWVLQQYLPEEQTAEAKVQCLAKLLNHRCDAARHHYKYDLQIIQTQLDAQCTTTCTGFCISQSTLQCTLRYIPDSAYCCLVDHHTRF